MTGKAVQAGAKLYFDHINAQGGVGGNQIRLLSRDDENKPEETVRLVKESLANEQPVAFLGSVGTNNIEALIRDGSLARANTPLIGPLSGASSMIGAPATYVVKATYRDEVESLFKQLGQTGQSKVGLVYQDDGMGKDVLNSADNASSKYSIQLVARAGYERNTLKVENAVDSMIKAAPQSIFLGATTAAAIEFVRQYRQKGGVATIYGLSIIDTQQLLAKLGPALGARLRLLGRHAAGEQDDLAADPRIRPPQGKRQGCQPDGAFDRRLHCCQGPSQCAQAGRRQRAGDSQSPERQQIRPRRLHAGFHLQQAYRLGPSSISR